MDETNPLGFTMKSYSKTMTFNHQNQKMALGIVSLDFQWRNRIRRVEGRFHGDEEDNFGIVSNNCRLEEIAGLCLMIRPIQSQRYENNHRTQIRQTESNRPL